MTLVVAEQDIYRACEVIFGPELDLSSDFLQYLQLSGVKTAYRKRALETHPDRFAALADAAEEQRQGVLFHDVREAYENLVNFLKAREEGIQLLANPTMTNLRTRPFRKPNGGNGRRPGNGGGGFTRPTGGFAGANFSKRNGGGFAAEPQRPRQPRPDNARGANPAFWSLEELYRGPLPDRRLLLGHFLYYSGVASWRTIVQALIWQRCGRPKIGEISRRFGILDEEAIALVLRSRSPRSPFGESALKLGLLDESQLRLLIQAQKRLQRKFGEYFVEQGILHPEQLADLLQEYHDHNNRLARQFSGRRP